MSDVAERVRQVLLAQKHGADRAAARAERLGAYLESVWDSGGEPTRALVNEYLSACRKAEVALLERAVAMPEAEGGQ